MYLSREYIPYSEQYLASLPRSVRHRLFRWHAGTRLSLLKIGSRYPIVSYGRTRGEFFTPRAFQIFGLWISAFVSLAGYGGFAYILFCLVKGTF